MWHTTQAQTDFGLDPNFFAFAIAVLVFAVLYLAVHIIMHKTGKAGADSSDRLVSVKDLQSGQARPEQVVNLISRAKQNETREVVTLLRQFVPEDEEVYFAQYLGTTGLMGFGRHSFGYLTEKRVATIRVGRLGEVFFQDGQLAKVHSAAVYQPSLLLLYVLVSLIVLAASYVFYAAMSEAPWPIAAAAGAFVLCGIPIVGRFYYWKKKSGAVFTVEGGIAVYLVMNRSLIGSANTLMQMMARAKQDLIASRK